MYSREDVVVLQRKKNTIIFRKKFTSDAIMKRLGRIWLLLLTNICIIVIVWILVAILEAYFGISISSYLWWGRVWLLIFSALFGMVWAFVSLWSSAWMAKRRYKLILIHNNNQDPRLTHAYETISRIARENDIKQPKLYIYQSKDINAFATWPSKNKSLVALSSSLIEALPQNELDAVIWHEMWHIINGDMITMTLLQWVINTFVIFLARVVAELINVAVSWDDEWWLWFFAYYAIVSILDVIFGLAGSLVLAGYSRRREFHADKAWALFTDKQSMIQAIRSISQKNKKSQAFVQDEFSTLKISWPQWRKRYFSTHPSTESRIKHLEELDLV